MPCRLSAQLLAGRYVESATNFYVKKLNSLKGVYAALAIAYRFCDDPIKYRTDKAQS